MILTRLVFPYFFLLILSFFFLLNKRSHPNQINIRQVSFLYFFLKKKVIKARTFGRIQYHKNKNNISRSKINIFFDKIKTFYDVLNKTITLGFYHKFYLRLIFARDSNKIKILALSFH